jgi:uncharacterized membrane protein
MRDHLKRRFFLGLVVFIPFGITAFVLVRIVGFGMDELTTPLLNLLKSHLGALPPEYKEWLLKNDQEHFVYWVRFIALIVTIVAVLGMLYCIGLFSATFLGKRYIAMGERWLMRIPGVPFLYNTIKQVIEIVSRPRSNAFQKVVLIEYPKENVHALAFYSGITVLPESGEVLVNVFIPTTPNPTSGFLLLLKSEEVQETNLRMAEATRFIISGGVVSLVGLQLKPFDLEPYQEEIERQKAVGKDIDGPARITGESKPEEVPGKVEDKDPQRSEP